VNHAEIVSHLSRLIDSPTSDFLYTISLKQVIQQIAHRMGDDALSLTQADLELARNEVQASIDHGLDYRPFVDDGLDVWEITRKL
jgi:hypothetical protein